MSTRIQGTARTAACMAAALFASACAHAVEDTVRASRFGFDGRDATRCLQAALDSGAKTVVIDDAGAEWLCRQLTINRDNLTVLFDEGVTVRALPGAFPNRTDAFFRLTKRKNVSFIGKRGSLVTMNKEEYRKIDSRFQGGHRHAFRCMDSDGVTFKNMTITSSGGDGIYVGHGSRNVVIEDTSCLDHARQGISVISCENLLIRNCHFDNTNGTPPQAGIDFEPNHNTEALINCVVENSTFNNNAGSGIAIYPVHLDGQSPPISITIRNCQLIGNGNGAMVTPRRKAESPTRGSIMFENCRIAGTENVTLRVTDPGKGLAFSMTGCTLDNTANNFNALTITSGSVLSPDIGNIAIRNVDVIDPAGRPPILFKPLYGCGVTDTISVDISLNGTSYDVRPALAKLHARRGPRPVLSKEKPERLAAPEVHDEVVNPKQRLNLRGDHKLMLLAKKGDRINLWMQANPTSRSGKPGTVSAVLRDPRKKAVKTFDILSDGTEHSFPVTAGRDGMYVLEINTRGQLVNVWSDHVGQGLLVSPQLAMLSPKCTYYFEVPAGVTDSAVLLCGSSSVEIINKVALLAPSGRVVQTESNTECAVLRIKRPEGAPSEIWCMDIRKTREDCYTLMGEHLRPIVSGSPQLLLRSR
ncbi:right-handed parallel beta-helix repeat-containing protein [bacterium]|nr:right-handed parallel beta-helix repeat-containing protein [bacterium]